MRKPSGYWKNIENVKRELKPLIDKLGRFPSNNEMIKEIGNSLPRYIMKYHGGILHLSQEMGLKNYDESIGRRTQGTWKKEDVVDLFQTKKSPILPPTMVIILLLPIPVDGGIRATHPEYEEYITWQWECQPGSLFGRTTRSRAREFAYRFKRARFSYVHTPGVWYDSLQCHGVQRRTWH